MHVITVDEKRGHAFEGKQGGECEKAWREVRETKINKTENYSPNFKILIIYVSSLHLYYVLCIKKNL